VTETGSLDKLQAIPQSDVEDIPTGGLSFNTDDLIMKALGRFCTPHNQLLGIQQLHECSLYYIITGFHMSGV
jgi:hypothetical protein